MMRRAFLLVTLVALAALAVGCAAGGSGTTLFDGSTAINFGQQR